MDFNTELSQFPSAVHSLVYFSARGIMPLSRTLDAVNDPALRESCVALHGFVIDMLSDMYGNPEAYHLPMTISSIRCLIVSAIWHTSSTVF